MATKTLRRAAAFKSLARALTSGARGGPSLGRRLAALPRMIRATIRGDYDAGLRLTLMTAATAYILSPVDVVPELMLAVFGLADDALMVAWLAGSVLSETERFLEWESRRDSVIPGDVLDGDPARATGRARAPRR
ncbi:YkvA family protein [Plantactinospora sp. CA-290183]|uniref:YkvA family protein n=1 Tax=Plantactinospora sp. CA-290183 TaxID=3240006 RepID=UPI003D93DF0B